MDANATHEAEAHARSIGTLSGTHLPVGTPWEPFCAFDWIWLRAHCPGFKWSDAAKAKLNQIAKDAHDAVMAQRAAVL